MVAGAWAGRRPPRAVTGGWESRSGGQSSVFQNLVFLPFLNVQAVQAQRLQRQEGRWPGPLKSGGLLATWAGEERSPRWVAAGAGLRAPSPGAVDSGAGMPLTPWFWASCHPGSRQGCWGLGMKVRSQRGCWKQRCSDTPVRRLQSPEGGGWPVAGPRVAGPCVAGPWVAGLRSVDWPTTGGCAWSGGSDHRWG